jgi:hypothetical protein
MKKQTGMDDELRSEYDLSELLKGGVRGKYADRYREGTNLVLLAPDVAAVSATGYAVGPNPTTRFTRCGRTVSTLVSCHACAGYLSHPPGVQAV